YSAWAHTFDMKKVGEMPERNTVLDVDGKIYSRLAGSNRLIASLNEVAPTFIDALLAREDTRFFQHNGIDFYGVGRALVRDLIRSPNRFSPLRNPDGAALQRDAVLNRMVELKKISIAQAQQAKSSHINPHPKKMPMIQENYAMDAVQRDLNVLLTQDQIDQG